MQMNVCVKKLICIACIPEPLISAPRENQKVMVWYLWCDCRSSLADRRHTLDSWQPIDRT